MKPLSVCQLYAFVDTAYLRGRSAGDIARQLCDGGADLIQLRAKESPFDEVRRLAESLLPITERAGVGLVINDHASIALAVGAPLCHLGQEDFFDAGYTQASELFPSDSPLLLGLSSHSPGQADRAVNAGAAYLGVGPVFATATKPSASPVSLDYVRWVQANITIPWFAIGGITLSNLDSIIEAGARRICVVSAIMNALDLAQACQQFKRRLPSLSVS